MEPLLFGIMLVVSIPGESTPEGHNGEEDGQFVGMDLVHRAFERMDVDSIQDVFPKLSLEDRGKPRYNQTSATKKEW